MAHVGKESAFSGSWSEIKSPAIPAAGKTKAAPAITAIDVIAAPPRRKRGKFTFLRGEGGERQAAKYGRLVPAAAIVADEQESLA